MRSVNWGSFVSGPAPRSRAIWAGGRSPRPASSHFMACWTSYPGSLFTTSPRLRIAFESGWPGPFLFVANHSSRLAFGGGIRLGSLLVPWPLAPSTGCGMFTQSSTCLLMGSNAKGLSLNAGFGVGWRELSMAAEGVMFGLDTGATRLWGALATGGCAALASEGGVWMVWL